MSIDSLIDKWEDPKKPVSEKIRDRIKKAGERFHANDNIAKHLEEGELDLLQAEVEAKMKSLLDSLVIDTENDHNTQDTARRVARCGSKKHLVADMHQCLK